MAGNLLTDQAIQSIKPGDGDRWCSDAAARGAGRLVLRIRPAAAGGSKSWYFRYTVPGGKRIDLRLGEYSRKGDARTSFTLQQARARVSELREIHKGTAVDVRAYLAERMVAEQAQREAARVEQERLLAEQKAASAASEAARRDAERYTLRALLDAYVRHLERLGKPSAADTRNRVRLHVFDAPDSPAEKLAREVTSRDVVALLRRLTNEGKGRTAAMLRSHIRAAYQMSATAELDPGIPAEFVAFSVTANPAALTDPLTRFNVARDRTLSAAELRLYMDRISALPSTQADVLQLALLLGGQRPEQLLRLKRGDVDLDASTVTLRDFKGRRKQPRVHVLPLSGNARAIVEKLVAKARLLGTQWLMVGVEIDPTHLHSLAQDGDEVTAGQRYRPLVIDTLSSAVTGISAELVKSEAVAERFQLRDIRRTAETMLAALGISKEIRAQLQSHGLGGVQDRHYDRHDYLAEKEQALKRWHARLKSIASGDSTAVVTRLEVGRDQRLGAVAGA